jgi:hypothetical protein
MVERLLEQRWPVSSVLSDADVTDASKRYLDMKPEDWLMLERLTAVLKPFKVATQYLSGDLYVSMSSLMPVITGLLENVATSEADSANIKQMKSTISKQLHERFPQIQPPHWIILALTASLLDPRFHSLSFVSNNLAAVIRSRVVVEMRQISTAESESDGEESSSSSSTTKTAEQRMTKHQSERMAEDALFSHIDFGADRSQESDEQQVKKELDLYLSQPNIKR